MSTRQVGSGAVTLRERRFIVSRNVAIEALDDDGVVVYRADTGARLRISRPLYELMRRFVEPAALPSIAGPAGLAAERGLALLVQKGFLVRFGESAGESECEPRLTVPAAYTLFNAPRARPGSMDARVAVVGASVDLGCTGEPGARVAPLEIRRRSHALPYRCAFDTGAPLGWFDVERRCRILERVTMADLGDVRHLPGEGLAVVLDRLQSVCEAVLDRGAFPVVIGGDHSVSFAPVRALSRRRTVAVVVLDADVDVDGVHAGAPHHDRSVLRRILSLSGVDRVVCVGVRSEGAHGGPPMEQADAAAGGDVRLHIITARTLREQGTAALLRALPPDVPCHVSIDLNVLDPASAPSVVRPVPGGPGPNAVVSLLRALGEAREIAALDVCGMTSAPDPSGLTAITASYLVIAVLAAAVDSPDGPGNPLFHDQGGAE